MRNEQIGKKHVPPMNKPERVCRKESGTFTTPESEAYRIVKLIAFQTDYETNIDRQTT